MTHLRMEDVWGVTHKKEQELGQRHWTKPGFAQKVCSHPPESQRAERVAEGQKTETSSS